MEHEFSNSWYEGEPYNNPPKDDSEIGRLRAFAEAAKVRDEWIEKSTKLTMKHDKTEDEELEAVKSWDQLSKAKWIYLKRFDEVFGTNKLQDVLDHLESEEDWIDSYAGSGDEWVDDCECVRAILNNEVF